MNKKRILYLEDDIELGEMTATFLQREGFHVQWKQSGMEGLKSFELETFDIVLADIMMPNIDGYTVLKSLRETQKEIPFIFLSARVLTEDIVKGFSLGADDYMRKPFSMDELVARINRLINKSSLKTEETVFEIGNYVYDAKSYQLKCRGKGVTLSPRMGEILHRFLIHEEHILYRKKTLMDLWGDDNFFTGRSLDVFIYKLRKQLSEDDNLQILNLRGIGYKLIIKS